jgi:hypothetical protein
MIAPVARARRGGGARPWIVQQFHKIALGLGTAIIAFVCTHLLSPRLADRLRARLVPTAEIGIPKGKPDPQGLACDYQLVARTKRVDKASITVRPACTGGFVLATGCTAGDPTCVPTAIPLVRQGEVLAVDQGVTLEIEAERLLHLDGCTTSCPRDVSMAWEDGSAEIDPWVVAPIIGWGLLVTTLLLGLALLSYDPLWAWWRRRQCWKAFHEAERRAWTSAPRMPQDLDDLSALLKVHGQYLFRPDDVMAVQEVARLVIVASSSPRPPSELDLEPRMVQVLREEFLATAEKSSLRFVEYCLAAVHVGALGQTGGDDD